MASTTTTTSSVVPSSVSSRRPSPVLVQGSLILGQVLFGLGSVIAALGLPACNPFAFALYREIAAGIILWIWSQKVKPNTATATTTISLPPLLHHWKRFTWLGLAIFGNQAGVIVGIKLAGPVTAAIWQPSQPIMTAAISMLLQWEPPHRGRIAGVLLSFLGCAAMVVLSAQERHPSESPSENSDTKSTIQLLVGNALFFVNCLSTSLYVILSKQPLKVYPPLTVAAWSYMIAAVFMAITALALAPALPLICPECTNVWMIPPGAAVYALAYFIIFNSVAAYAILTWANQYATGTLVMGYSVLQPVTAALFTGGLLQLGVYPNCATGATATIRGACLDSPGKSAIFGMLGVLGGLGLVIFTEPTTRKNEGKRVYKPIPLSLHSGGTKSEDVEHASAT